MINAKILADSLSPQGHRLTTFEVVFPRIVLAEFNTHRMFSRNSASSRAIPFSKMVKDVIKNPFVPIAFQKSHSGMQGTDYIDPDKRYTWSEIFEILNTFLRKSFRNEDGHWDEEYVKMDNVLNENVLPLLTDGQSHTVSEWWLKARDLTASSAILLNAFGVTKQICNRLLEHFMYHKVIVTTTEEGLENFFKLRCPQYSINRIQPNNSTMLYRSWKDLVKDEPQMAECSLLERLEINKSHAEIHIAALAEAMWDVYNESTPKQLRVGEWHIPFGDNISENKLEMLLPKNHHFTDINMLKIKIATARCARISYQTLGDNPVIDYSKDIALHDMLLADGHMSPFEHCAKATNDSLYHRNFQGFIQYREIIEN